jgi:hypothetical protein
MTAAGAFARQGDQHLHSLVVAREADDVARKHQDITQIRRNAIDEPAPIGPPHLEVQVG